MGGTVRLQREGSSNGIVCIVMIMMTFQSFCVPASSIFVFMMLNHLTGIFGWSVSPVLLDFES